MSLCSQCGLTIPQGEELCPHHTCSVGDDWAEANRLICDFLHRKKLREETAEERAKRKEFLESLGESA